MTNSNGAIRNLKSRLVFAAYAEPATPSEVAQRLRLPANTVHYWTRKLEAEGLLEHVESKGRSRTYRANEEALAADPHSVLPFVRNLVGGLGKLVMGAAERWVLDGGEALDGAPHVEVHELRLRGSNVPALVASLKETLADRLDDVPEGEGEMFTLAFVAVPGRLSEQS